MADMLDNGEDWLNRALHSSASVVVLYSPLIDGEYAESSTIAATVGETVFQRADDEGFSHRDEYRDFIFLRSAFEGALAGVATSPKRGDRVTLGVAGGSEIYEVTSPGDEPEWQWSGPSNGAIRVHTQRVGSA